MSAVISDSADVEDWWGGYFNQCTQSNYCIFNYFLFASLIILDAGSSCIIRNQMFKTRRMEPKLNHHHCHWSWPSLSPSTNTCVNVSQGHQRQTQVFSIWLWTNLLVSVQILRRQFCLLYIWHVPLNQVIVIPLITIIIDPYGDFIGRLAMQWFCWFWPLALLCVTSDLDDWNSATLSRLLLNF